MIVNVLQCIVVSLAFWFSFDISVHSIIPLLIGIMYGMILKHHVEKDKSLKTKIVVIISSTVFTLFILFAQIESVLKFDSSILCLVSLVISSSGLFLFFKLLIERLFVLLSQDELVFQSTEKCLKNPMVVFGGVLAILLLSWGMNFLIDFPGIVGVDTIENLEQAVGSRKMDVLFPFYMTLYLRACWNTGLILWGSANAGIALYSVTQMVVLAIAVSYLVYCLYKYNVKKILLVLIVLYFAIIPYHAHGSYMLLKDTPYAIGTMLFILSLWEFYILGIPNKKTEKVFKYLLFLFSGILMALSRANGYYVFVFCLPFILYLFYRRQKKIVGLIICSFLAIMVVRGPISDLIINQNNKYVDGIGTPVFDIRYVRGDEETEVVVEASEEVVANKKNTAQVSNANSSYGSSGVFIITAQQLGRVTVDRELTDEEYSRLSTVINVDEMKATYNKYIVTNSMSQITNHNMKEYFSVWLEFGLKYPYTYFIAWRDQTQGYWDPNMYTGEFDLDFCDRNPEVYRDSLFSTQFVDRWNSVYETALVKVPMLPLLWSNGFIICLTFFAVALTAVKRNWTEIFLFTPLIGLWLTLLVANPCNGQLRYVYSFFLCLPLSFIIPFVKERSEEKENEHLLHQ